MIVRHLLLLSCFLLTINSRGAVENCPGDAEKLLTTPLKGTPVSLVDLRGDFRARVAGGRYLLKNSEKLEFVGTQGRDVYNSTAVFRVRFRARQIEVLLGRTEETAKETG